MAVSALAWLDLDEKGRLFLEVAEDYTTVAVGALKAVQVKDTKHSGSATLKSKGVKDAIASFVNLTTQNAAYSVELRYLTTSQIGMERSVDDRPSGIAGLHYWRKAASGADVDALRKLLESTDFPEAVREFVCARDDEAVRRDLLKRIHWDCGQLDFESVRQELEERAIILCRDRFQIPTDEARRIPTFLMYHVLKKSILPNSSERVLTRAELYTVIDSATRLSMPRAAADRAMELSSTLAQSMVGAGSKPFALGGADSWWLVSGTEFPGIRQTISRPAIEAIIEKILSENGLAVLVGGSGLGKSLIARSISRKQATGYITADFRDIEEVEARYRLNLLLGRLGDIAQGAFIFEDLNHLEIEGVSRTLGRVSSALRRRDRVGIITCYRKPSAHALAELGLDSRIIFEIPYFDEAEVRELVRVCGGNPEIWARVAYIAGALGHPQLVHAFATGMAARGWPQDAVHEIASRGLTSEDVDVERDAARRRIAAALPADARTLLYRLGLTIGNFDRELALGIATLSTAVPNAGEHLDELIGPWIETVAVSRYRLSPMASTAGHEHLPVGEQKKIHGFIAMHLLARRNIVVSDASMILTHALLGEADTSLLALAHSVITADRKTLSLLTEHFFMLRMLRMDTAIYAHNPTISRVLRLAQFKLIAQSADVSAIRPCVTALLNETAQEANLKIRTAFETLVLGAVLITAGIANHLPDWINLLVRFRSIVEANTKQLRKLKIEFERRARDSSFSLYGSLFAIGVHGISSIKRLEEIFAALDTVPVTARNEFLGEYAGLSNDYGLFVNSAWLAEHERQAVNGTEAADQYSRMAAFAQKWGIRPLAVRCHVARSIMLDEYANDETAGLRALDDGMAAVGIDPVLSRARAKILWRHDDFPGALKILRDIVDQFGRNDPVERAYALREAAICAANVGDWSQAETWFSDGAIAAATAKTADMRAMAIGLGADAAVAAVNIRQFGRAIERFAAALTALKTINPNASTKTAYYHRVVRHAVLWLASKTNGELRRHTGNAVEMMPGACSNPEPPEAIKELPLGALDIAWYMLAEAEIAAGARVGIAESLVSRLAAGPIPTLEVSLRIERIRRAIADLDAINFSEHLHSWIEGMLYFRSLGAERRREFNPVAPERGLIPALSKEMLSDKGGRVVAVNAILVFCMAALFKRQRNPISNLEARLADVYGREPPGEDLFRYWRGEQSTLDDLDHICADAIRVLREGGHVEPQTLWMIGLRFFEKIRQSGFAPSLVSLIAQWLREEWARIIRDEAFRLSQPLRTVPAIEAVLTKSNNDGAFVAELLLATENAVGSPLAVQYRGALKRIAGGDSVDATQTSMINL